MVKRSLKYPHQIIMLALFLSMPTFLRAWLPGKTELEELCRGENWHERIQPLLRECPANIEDWLQTPFPNGLPPREHVWDNGGGACCVTPMHVLVRHNCVGLFRLLLEKVSSPFSPREIDLGLRDCRGRSLLDLAAIAGSLPMAELLLSYGAVVENSGWITCFEWGIVSRHIGLMQLFHRHGADIKRKAPFKLQTPLHNSVGYFFPEGVRFLLMHGADPACQDSDGNHPVEHPCAHHVVDGVCCADVLSNPPEVMRCGVPSLQSLSIAKIWENVVVRNIDGLRWLIIKGCLPPTHLNLILEQLLLRSLVSKTD